MKEGIIDLKKIKIKKNMVRIAHVYISTNHLLLVQFLTNVLRCVLNKMYIANYAILTK